MSFYGPLRPQFYEPVPVSKTSTSVDNLPNAITVYANAVYYPNYRVYRHQPPSSLNFGIISHVIYAFAGYCTLAFRTVHTTANHVLVLDQMALFS
jgi:hypothetical protein